MFRSSDIFTTTCPSPDIAAYIDGELDPARELELELHFAQCETCTVELNSQKQFLLCLDAGLKEETALELPAGFAHEVAVNAEASVAGLRRPSELYHFVFICTAVVLFVLFAAGPRSADLLDAFFATAEKVVILTGFFGHLVFDVFVGVAVVLRAFAAQLGTDITAMAVLSVLFAVPVLLFSRKMLRVGRA